MLMVVLQLKAQKKKIMIKRKCQRLTDFEIICKNMNEGDQGSKVSPSGMAQWAGDIV